MLLTNKTLERKVAESFKSGEKKGGDDTRRLLNARILMAELAAENAGYSKGYKEARIHLIRDLLESNTIIYDEKIGYGCCNKIAIAGRSDADIAAVIEQVEVGVQVEPSKSLSERLKDAGFEKREFEEDLEPLL